MLFVTTMSDEINRKDIRHIVKICNKNEIKLVSPNLHLIINTLVEI